MRAARLTNGAPRNPYLLLLHDDGPSVCSTNSDRSRVRWYARLWAWWCVSGCGTTRWAVSVATSVKYGKSVTADVVRKMVSAMNRVAPCLWVISMDSRMEVEDSVMVCRDMISGFGAKIAGWQDRDGADAMPVPPKLGARQSVRRALISALCPAPLPRYLGGNCELGTGSTRLAVGAFAVNPMTAQLMSTPTEPYGAG